MLKGMPRTNKAAPLMDLTKIHIVKFPTFALKFEKYRTRHSQIFKFSNFQTAF